MSERLTKRIDGGIQVGCVKYLAAGATLNALDRLAAYEDLGTVEALAALVEASRWIPVTERLPMSQTKVLVQMVDKASGRKHTTTASHIGYHEQDTESNGWEDYEGETEYDEDKDCFWVHSCWYEVNMVDDNPNYELDGECEITHWRPLPTAPEKGAEHEQNG